MKLPRLNFVRDVQWCLIAIESQEIDIPLHGLTPRCTWIYAHGFDLFGIFLSTIKT